MQQLWEVKENKKKERLIKGRDLVDVVFSWSVLDVLNSNLYKGKVLFFFFPERLKLLLRNLRVKTYFLLTCFVDFVCSGLIGG